MIVNNTHHLVFVHIPKCAGSSVREVLQKFDDINDKKPVGVAGHPQLGVIDYAHIPLFILKRYFHVEFKKIQQYTSFALVREPADRFPSSVSQYLRMYSERDIREMDRNEIKSSVDGLIDTLVASDDSEVFLPYQLIHFQRQVDYLYLGDERVIANIYTVHSVDKMIKSIEEHLNKKGGEILEGLQDVPQKHNETLLYRNNFFRKAVYVLRPLFWGYLTYDSKVLIKKKVSTLFFVHRDRKLRDIFDSDYVKDFVKDYCSKDIALYSNIEVNEASHYRE